MPERAELAPGGERREATLAAADGFELGATLHLPPDGGGDRLVVVNGAMGVPRHFYGRLADFLAGRGLPAVTWDYRGIGGSLHGPVRRSPARLRDWGERDLAGVLSWAARCHPERRLVVVAHSVGGQILGLAAGIERVEAVFMISCQSGHWRLWSGLGRAKMLAVWYLVVPALTALLGYLPLAWLGAGEDVPAGVAREWARWGRRRRYVLDGVEEAARQGYRRLRAEVESVSVSDDFYAPRAAVEELLTFYPRARSRHRVVTPASLGVERIGHFALFRDRFRQSFWPQVAAWLLRR